MRQYSVTKTGRGKRPRFEIKSYGSGRPPDRVYGLDEAVRYARSIGLDHDPERALYFCFSPKAKQRFIDLVKGVEIISV